MNKYQVQTCLKHEEMHRCQIMKAADVYELKYKAIAQFAQWEAEWKREKQLEKEYPASGKETREDSSLKLNRLLKISFGQAKVKWVDLKNQEPYPFQKPSRPPAIPAPLMPDRNDERYLPPLSFLDRIIKSRKEAAFQKAEEQYQNDYEEYEEKKKNVEEENRQALRYFENELKKWERNKEEYARGQEVDSHYLEEMEKKWASSDPRAITFFVDRILAQLTFPIEFVREVESEYFPDKKLLVVDYGFPDEKDLPVIKKEVFSEERADISESLLRKQQPTLPYEQLIYQMVLVLLNKIFRNTGNKLDRVILNGKIPARDPSIEKTAERYVLSVQVNRKDFEKIKLNTLDPREWFRTAGGIAAVPLTSMQVILPITRITPKDIHFIESTDLLNQAVPFDHHTVSIAF